MKKCEIPPCYVADITASYSPHPRTAGCGPTSKQTMTEYVQKQLAQLKDADDATIDPRYKELVSDIADPHRFSREWKLQRIAYALQSAATGDKLSEQELQTLAFLATKDWRCNPSVRKPMKQERKPTRGSTFIRSYKGKDYEMTVDSLGRFVYEGRVYRSCTSIAREITGSHVNGKIWWGLRKEVDA